MTPFKVLRCNISTPVCTPKSYWCGFFVLHIFCTPCGKEKYCKMNVKYITLNTDI